MSRESPILREAREVQLRALVQKEIDRQGSVQFGRCPDCRAPWAESHEGWCDGYGPSAAEEIERARLTYGPELAPG